MRRLIVSLGLVPLVTLALGVQPASAHVAFHIVGYQFAYLNDGFQPGIAGWVSGPVRVTDGPTTDGLEDITNHDGIGHTFTQCLGACETITPVYPSVGSPGFDVSVPSGQTVDISGLGISGTVVFGCRVHPFMRGEVTVTG